MVPIIGLVGRSRVGKDTVAGFFADTHKARKLARPVKDACKALYGWTDLEVEGPAKEDLDLRWGLTPRVAMVHLTDALRSFHGPGFFTRQLFDTWDGTPMIVTDVRYKRDLDEIHARGGVTIKISRDTGPGHEFEDEIDQLQTTYEITNNGTLDGLRGQIDRLKFRQDSLDDKSGHRYLQGR
jgi:hypothetical protein